MANPTTAPVTLPRITVTYCTQCKWLLRAAWLQQELLSTFGGSIGEIALVPATGGIFQIHLTRRPPPSPSGDTGSGPESEVLLLWDRKAEGGFPEAKVLKQRVRDCIDPDRGLGHADVPAAAAASRAKAGEGEGVAKGGWKEEKEGCEDCT